MFISLQWLEVIFWVYLQPGKECKYVARFLILGLLKRQNKGLLGKKEMVWACEFLAEYNLELKISLLEGSTSRYLVCLKDYGHIFHQARLCTWPMKFMVKGISLPHPILSMIFGWVLGAAGSRGHMFSGSNWMGHQNFPSKEAWITTANPCICSLAKHLTCPYVLG